MPAHRRRSEHCPKPKNILSRVILGESWQERDTTDYLYVGFGCNLSGLQPQAQSSLTRPADNGNNGDGSSIISISTTATADDLPGTGRLVDMFIYQPVGRWIERLAMRFTISSLHPSRIAQYIEAQHQNYDPAFFSSWTLNYAIADLCDTRRSGSTVVAGMKGLVKQTRSASALAALIRVSLSESRREIYVTVSHVEPIFHLETLTGSLVCSQLEKKWFLLLAKLARETLVAVRSPSVPKTFDPILGKEVYQLQPSFVQAQCLRQKLIQVLNVCRCSGFDSLEDTIGESCAICAEALSTCIDECSRGDAYMHILETVYFALVFILQSIFELANYSTLAANEHTYMVLRTLAFWVDAIVYRCLCAVAYDRPERFDMNALEAKMSFFSLVLSNGNSSRMLLPESTASIVSHKTRLMDQIVLPRAVRMAADRNEDNPVAQSLIVASIRRTQQLLRSFDELDREVWGCSSQTFSSLKIDADPYWFSGHDFGQEWWEYWKSTLVQAQRVQVAENDLTKEFKSARLWTRDWARYYLHRLSRHKWGQCIRSNMDWDWDLGTCMSCLFKVQKQARVRSSLATHGASNSSPAINVVPGPGGALKISMRRAKMSMPKEIQITYETEDGETQYASFVPAISGSGCHPNSETTDSRPSAKEISNLVVAQQDLGYGKGSSGGEPEVEDARSNSSDDERFVDCESMLLEESVGDIEGRQLPNDIGYQGVQAGGEDAISICSLD